MSLEFRGPRTAIVTGGARRIGAEIARALSADGWHLILHCNRSLEEGKALAARLGNAVAVGADLAEADAAATIFRSAAGLPPLRLLVNNASQFNYDSADEFTVERWDAHQAINLRAPALLSQAFARAAAETGAVAEGDGEPGGLIVNLLDAKLAQPNPDFFTYTISKIGLAGLTELTARAYAARRIRVCGIAPSVTLVSGPQSRENFSKVHRMNALRRGVDVDQIVAALRFIIATPTLTGQIITLDAGQRFLSLPRDVQFLEPDNE